MHSYVAVVSLWDHWLQVCRWRDQIACCTVTRPLSAGTIVRLVSLQSSLRALDSAGGRLGPN